MFHDLIRDLDHAVAHTFQVMLALDCIPISTVPPGQTPQPSVVATVNLSGAVAGWFAIAVDQQAAHLLASTLTGLPQQDLAGTLSFDSVAELCNVIAGNWKSRRPPPVGNCALSPPVATHRPRQEDTLTRLYSFASYRLELQLSFA